MNELASKVFGSGLLGLVLLACAVEPQETASEDSPTEPGDQVVAQGGKKPAPGGSKSGEPAADAACPYAGPPIVDVSGMAACRGAGRCVPGSAVPKDQQAMLAPCDGGFCVAEDLVAYAGKKLLTSCKSIAGGEGRCMSRVFPGIDEQKDRLPQDACKESERCAPCFDPATGADTGVCKLISCDAPKQPAKTFGACCSQSGKANGKCVPKTLMTPAEAEQLDRRECTSDQEVCAPAENFDPKHVPQKCRGSVALLGAYDGVCISTCVPRDFLAQIGTSQGNCDALHFCAPCKNPLTGQPTGAPGCGP
ncbi:MAG: hypothetical protein JST00_19435 [Deltaproteobacteria bacterium]|nr:hypothetical protein [Deltaproteobacteria bacterium]